MTEFQGAIFTKNDTDVLAVEQHGDDYAVLVRCPNCKDFTVVGYLNDRNDADLFIASISAFLSTTIFPIH